MAAKAKRAALIGYDCLIPKRLEAMLAQGGLDNFRRFMAEGSFIPKATTCHRDPAILGHDLHRSLSPHARRGRLLLLS